MKCRLSQCVALVALSVLFFCGTAQALTFEVSDITFENLTGNTEGLQWTLTKATIDQIVLEPSKSKTFKYGQLSIVSPSDSAEVGDSFDVDLSWSLPDPAALASGGFGDIEATITGGKKLSVLFSNQNWIDVYFNVDGFDVAGRYSVRFLGFNNAKYGDNSVFDLLAEIHYISAPTVTGGLLDDQSDGPAPVPEPSTMVLFGAGLLGLVYVSRKKTSR